MRSKLIDEVQAALRDTARNDVGRSDYREVARRALKAIAYMAVALEEIPSDHIVASNALAILGGSGDR